MRSRRPTISTSTRAIASILAACIILTAATVNGQSVDRFPPAQRDRALHAARTTQELLAEWFGPSTLRPVLTEVPIRWLAFERDRSLERAVIAAVTRQYWSDGGDSSAPFRAAIVVYTGTRAIHHLLEGSNFLVVRFFGGVIPFPLRPVLLSPPVADPRPRVWQFDELPEGREVARLVRGLQTLERYVGWPTMAQAIAAIRANRAVDAKSFATTLAAVRGTDVVELVEECFRPDATFDYAIEDVQVSPVGNGLYESSLLLRRNGSGVFAVRSDEDREPSMPILMRFADGTEMRDWFDGAQPTTSLVYTAKSPVVYAAIDPDMMLLLDVNRSNNTFARESPIRPLGVRLALHWMAWLQHTMLAYAALV